MTGLYAVVWAVFVTVMLGAGLWLALTPMPSAVKRTAWSLKSELDKCHREEAL